MTNWLDYIARITVADGRASHGRTWFCDSGDEDLSRQAYIDNFSCSSTNTIWKRKRKQGQVTHMIAMGLSDIFEGEFIGNLTLITQLAIFNAQRIKSAATICRDVNEGGQIT